MKFPTTNAKAVTPAWVEKLKLAFYWGGLVLAWCSPIGFFLVVWSQPYRTQEKNAGMFPLNIHTSSVNTPTLNPTIVSADLQPSGPDRSTHGLLRIITQVHNHAWRHRVRGDVKVEEPLTTLTPIYVVR